MKTTKSPLPPECQHLLDLLGTPFRYGRYPKDSRVRRAGKSAGVFHGAEDPVTAVTDTYWHMHDFFEGSPGTPIPEVPATYTAFSVPVRSPLAIDLTEPPKSSEDAH